MALDGGVSFNVHINIDADAVERRFRPVFRRVTQTLANEALKSSTPYVPYDTGATTFLGQVVMLSDTKANIQWRTAYVRYIYYGFHMNFQTTHHALARAQWFEGAKAVNLDTWVQKASEAAKG